MRDTGRKSREEKEERGVRRVSWEWQTLLERVERSSFVHFQVCSRFRLLNLPLWVLMPNLHVCGKEKTQVHSLCLTAQPFIWTTYVFHLLVKNVVEAELFQCIQAEQRLVFIAVDKAIWRRRQRTPYLPQRKNSKTRVVFNLKAQKTGLLEKTSYF